MGSSITQHVDLHNKCGTCVHATPKPTNPSCMICYRRTSLPAQAQSIIRRTTKRCPNYIFDPSKLCPCGETPVPWYNYCPTCGRKIK